MGDNLNVQPIKLPLFINAQLGFMAVYLLASFDDLVRRLLLAHHIALIDRATLDGWIEDGGHALRSLFALAQQYRYSGASREDFAANNAVALAARDKFGELPPEIMDGTRRSRYALPLSQLPASKDSQDAPTDETSPDDSNDAVSVDRHQEDEEVAQPETGE